MKVGFKFFPDRFELIPQYQKYADFIEIMITPDLDITMIPQCEIPLTVHAPHGGFGFNPGDKNLRKHNQDLLKKAITVAREIKSPWVVTHVGFPVDNQSEETALNFFKENYHPLIVFENCAIVGENHSLNRLYSYNTPEGMEILLDYFQGRMLLDFEHAIQTANLHKKDPKAMIDQFFILQPDCFHISGIDLDAQEPVHGHLTGKRNDYSYLLKIRDDQWAALETGEPKKDNLQEFLEDIGTIKYLASHPPGVLG